MTESDVTVVLDNVESNSFVFKYLWTSQEERKCPLNILDTIIFKDGRPYRWLFTSSKSGEVMKKKTENLWTDEIVSALKNKAKVLRSSKARDTCSFIATVWFIESDFTVRNCHIGELHLARLLNNGPIHEVLAIQTYTSGWPLKASGIFEHQITRDNENKLCFDTRELLHSPIDDQVSIYTDDLRKLVIVELQHEMIKTASKRLIRHIERTTSAMVSSMVAQVVFTSSWTPIFTAFRSVILRHAPAVFYSSRDAMIFPGGKVPVPPLKCARQNISKKQQQELSTSDPIKSAFIASATGVAVLGADSSNIERANDYRDVNQARRDSVSKSGAAASMTTGKAAAAAVSRIVSRAAAQDEQSDGSYYRGTESRKYSQKSVQSDKDPDSVRARLKVGVENDAFHPQRDVGTTQYDTAPILADDKQSNRVSTARKYSSASTRRRASASSAAQGQSLPSAVVMVKEVVNDVVNSDNTESPQDDTVRFRPAAEAATAEKYNIPDFPDPRWDDLLRKESVEPVAKRRPSSALALAKRKERERQMVENIARDYDIRPSVVREYEREKTHGSTANAGSAGMVAPNNNTATAPKLPVEPARHLIATEASKLRSSFYANQIKPEEGLQVSKNFVPKIRPSSAPVSVASRSRPKSADYQLGRHGVEKGGVRASGLQRPLPISSGNVCYGDHCHFGKVDALGRQMALSVAKKIQLQQSSRGEIVCPFQLPFKSVLLERAEAKYLGVSIDTDTDVQFQLRHQLAEVDSILATYAREQLQRVASKCRNDIRDVLFVVGMQRTTDEWDELNAGYRRLVYSEALRSVHPSRFYYTVPMCEICYKLYTQMDLQRDQIVLMHHHSNHPIDDKEKLSKGISSPSDRTSHRLSSGLAHRNKSEPRDLASGVGNAQLPNESRGTAAAAGTGTVIQTANEHNEEIIERYHDTVAPAASSESELIEEPSPVRRWQSEMNMSTMNVVSADQRATFDPIGTISSSSIRRVKSADSSRRTGSGTYAGRTDQDFSSSKFRNTLRNRAISARLQIEQQEQEQQFLEQTQAVAGLSPTVRSPVSRPAKSNRGDPLAEAAVAIAASAAIMASTSASASGISPSSKALKGYRQRSGLGLQSQQSFRLETTAADAAGAADQPKVNGLEGRRQVSRGSVSYDAGGKNANSNSFKSFSSPKNMGSREKEEVSFDDVDDPWNDVMSEEKAESNTDSASGGPVRFSKVSSSINGRPLPSRPHGTISSWVKLLTTANNASTEAAKSEKHRTAAAKRRKESSHAAKLDKAKDDDIRLFDDDDGRSQQNKPLSRRPQSASSPRTKDISSTMRLSGDDGAVARPQPPTRPRSATSRSPAFALRGAHRSNLKIAEVENVIPFVDQNPNNNTADVVFDGDQRLSKENISEDRSPRISAESEKPYQQDVVIDNNDETGNRQASIDEEHEGDDFYTHGADDHPMAEQANSINSSSAQEKEIRQDDQDIERRAYFADDDLDYGDDVVDVQYSYATMPFTAAPLFPLGDSQQQTRRRSTETMSSAPIMQRPPRPAAKALSAPNVNDASSWPQASSEDISAIMADLWPDHVADIRGTTIDQKDSASKSRDDAGDDDDARDDDMNYAADDVGDYARNDGGDDDDARDDGRNYAADDVGDYARNDVGDDDRNDSRDDDRDNGGDDDDTMQDRADNIALSSRLSLNTSSGHVTDNNPSSLFEDFSQANDDMEEDQDTYRRDTISINKIPGDGDEPADTAAELAGLRIAAENSEDYIVTLSPSPERSLSSVHEY